MLPADGVSLAVRQLTGIEFGKMKSIFDTTNVVIAGVLALLLYGAFKGVGWGTIVSGIIIGYFVGLYKKISVRIINIIKNNS